MARNLLEISKRRRRRWAFIKFSAWILAALAALGGLASLFYIPSLRLKTISISGLEGVREMELREELYLELSGKYLRVLPKDHLLFLPKKELEAVLRSKLRIEEFSVEREFPSTLKISVRERKSWAIWCRKEAETLKECALSDKSGFIFAASPMFSGSAVLKIIDERPDSYLGRYVLEPEKFAALTSFMGRLESKTNEEIATLEVKSAEVLNIVFKSGWFLVIDLETDFSRALENLAITLNEIGERREKLEYADLRFADKIFYRFKE